MYLHLQCDGTNVAVKVCYTHALGRRGHRLVVVRAAVVAPPPPPSRGTVFPSTLLGVQCRLEVSLGSGEIVHSRVEVSDGGVASRKPDEEFDARHSSSDKVLYKQMDMF